MTRVPGGFRPAVVSFIMCVVVAGGCSEAGQEADSPPEASQCDGFEQLTAELDGASRDEAARAVRDVIGDDVPAELVGPLSVLDDASSSSDERDEAFDDVGKWFFVECGGASDGELRLVPTQVPSDLVLCFALDLPTTDPDIEPSTPTIWGDASLDDPWAGPLVSVSTDDDGEVPVHDGAEEISLHGVSGFVAPMPLFQAVSSAEWGHIATWRDPSGPVVEVATRGASPTEAVRIAELVTLGDDGTPSLPTDALGSETAPISDDLGVRPYGLSSTDGWNLQYGGDMEAGAEDPRLLIVSGSPGVSDDLQPLRFSALTAEPFEIRNQVGLEYAAFDAETGPFGIAWEETPGLIVQVVGLGLDQQTVRDVAASLEEVDAGGWRAAKQDVVDAACF